MRKIAWVVLSLTLGFAFPVRAQMGMDLFKRPSIAKVFHPVVGKGAQYEDTSKDAGSGQKPRTMELATVGKESVEGKEGYWMQFVLIDDKGQTTIGKSLITVDDFQYHKFIIQAPGQPAMEMPFTLAAGRREKMQDNLEGWHSAGSEPVSVPAGTFLCEHWRNDKTNSDVWTSDKVTPFGMVKESNPHSSMVLTKVLGDVPDRITGPVQKIDPQMMMQQMQQRRQQQKP